MQQKIKARIIHSSFGTQGPWVRASCYQQWHADIFQPNFQLGFDQLTAKLIKQKLKINGQNYSPRHMVTRSEYSNSAVGDLTRMDYGQYVCYNHNMLV